MAVQAPNQECPVVRTVREALDFCDQAGIGDMRERLLTAYLALSQQTSAAHVAAARQARRILGLRGENKE